MKQLISITLSKVWWSGTLVGKKQSAAHRRQCWVLVPLTVWRLPTTGMMYLSPAESKWQNFLLASKFYCFQDFRTLTNAYTKFFMLFQFPGSMWQQKLKRTIWKILKIAGLSKPTAKQLCDFFSLKVFFHEHSWLTGQKGKGEIFFNSSLPLLPASQALWH